MLKGDCLSSFRVIHTLSITTPFSARMSHSIELSGIFLPLVTTWACGVNGKRGSVRVIVERIFNSFRVRVIVELLSRQA